MFWDVLYIYSIGFIPSFIRYVVLLKSCAFNPKMLAYALVQSVFS